MITGAAINVLDYGAVGNGVADDTAAIQAAITAAHIGGQTAGNKPVLMPAGVYLISSSLALPDYCTLIGDGSFNTIIIGSMANKSFIRSQYGESPTIGQRPTGLHLRDFSIQPSLIASSSIGVNFKNTQYSNIENVFITQVDTGVITDQITQYCNFENVIVQVSNYGGLFQGSGGGNRIISCDFGANIIPLDFNGGAWDVFGATAEALLTSTTYCVRAGRSGGASTLVQATSLYVEGTSSSIITLQIENSVTQSAFKMHRHSTLGTIVNNAGTNVMIEVPGQGFYNPVYRAQRVGFALTVDGTEYASLITEAGNSIAVRNSANTGYGSISALDFYHSGSYSVRWAAGAGSPEGSVTGSPGAMYLRNNGGANTTLYIKESGTGNTGWVGK